MGETSFDTAVRLAVMDSFVGGTTPSVGAVARTLGAEIAAVEGAFDRLAAGRAIVLTPGTRDIRMAAPFAGVPTDFRVRVGERSYYANCIWDAVGIPAMLAGAARSADARIETECADCSAPVGLTVDAGHLTTDVPGAVVHFAVPAARWWADIVFT
jgi:hypothetical protein